MTPEQRYWWRIALELKLRKSSGDAFQDFFSTVMAKAHGADFVRLRAFGSLGDKGCDGYLESMGVNSLPIATPFRVRFRPLLNE